MLSNELKDIRHEIKFSMQDISLCLGVPKTTYQRYEDGTAQIPAQIERGALELLNINRTFIETAPARIDERIAREFPHGFLSEVENVH